jgi:CDP-diacylglycerol--glycerol-3-phosphate 3-phosphatidyltransferase
MTTATPRAGGTGGLGRGLIPDWLDARFTRSVAPVIRRLILARANPNAITVAALLLTALGGLCIAQARLVTAFLLIVAGGILDFCDGKVATLTGRVSVFGGILDSALDRYADAAVYLGLAVFFARDGHGLTGFAALLALVGSMTTSYLMALGQAHGFRFRSGLLRRQDRVTLIATGLALSPLHAHVASGLTVGAQSLGLVLPAVPVMPLALVVWVLAPLTNLTALQRLATLRRLTSGGSAATPGGEESLRDRQIGALRSIIGQDGGGGRAHG